MRARRDTTALKAKALTSLRNAAQAFNGFDNAGRVTSVLLHAQHTLEMLLKAGLTRRGVSVFDSSQGRSIGFEKCVNLALPHLDLTAEEAGVCRAVDALRDQEQHWLAAISEGLLYLYLRATVTVADDVLQ